MIRPAAPADAPAIRAVHEAAFPTPAEADLVEALVADGDGVVALVDARNGTVAGHVLLSRMRVGGGDRAYRALGLAPVAVLPGHQGARIGSRLIEAALAVAEAMGEELVFVLGEPDYYRRFGFAAETAAPFASPYAGPYFMALKLNEDLPLPRSGAAAYAPAFAHFGAGT
ncbi:MAG: GNAT family N-acetyltransferase [Sphingomonas sp.]